MTPYCPIAPSPPAPLPGGRGERRINRSGLCENMETPSGRRKAPSAQGERGLGVRGRFRTQKKSPVYPLFTSTCRCAVRATVPKRKNDCPRAAAQSYGCRRRALAGFAKPSAWRFEVSAQDACWNSYRRLSLQGGPLDRRDHRSRSVSNLVSTQRRRFPRSGLWSSPFGERTGSARTKVNIGAHKSRRIGANARLSGKTAISISCRPDDVGVGK